MKAKKTTASLILRAMALFILATAIVVPVATCVPLPATAQGLLSGNGAAENENGDLDTNKGTAYLNRKMYFYRFPAAKEAGPTELGGHDVIKDQKSVGPGTIIHSKSGPVYVWPLPVPTAISQVPTKRDEMISDDLFQTFGYPVSDTQFQIIQRYNDNRMLEEAYDPERIMWTSAATAGMQATSAANGAADMSTNQTRSAIDFTKKYLTNFTSQQNNRWQQIRDQLFIPMAILLLLPGAVLAQVKSIISQGSPVLGDTNPWEGILRSIIAIFLIPATFLVINYGIDVSNSITLTIAQEYKRIFGSDMYDDAQCGQLRAFPVNPARRNDNAMIASEVPPTVTGPTAWDPYEALSLNLRQYDPCAKIDKTRTQDERVRDIKKITRLMMNGANVGMTGTWNVMCAFQMAFLYYLWCMGPIAAALWVWPMAKLRGALPSWIEGVVTLCFWSLFWNTVVLLMACFRGVGDSGTVIMSALNFLADICVKYAFDFTSLVSQGASQGVSSAMNNAAQGAGAAAGGAAKGGGGGAGAAGKAGGTAAGAAGSTASSAAKGGMTPAAASLNSALSRATAANSHSGVGGPGAGSFSSAAHLAGGHAMPPGSTTAGGAHTPTGGFHPGGPSGSDQGLPPSSHPSGATGLGTTLAGGGAPNPIGGHSTDGTTAAALAAGAMAAGVPAASLGGANGAAGLGPHGQLGANGLGLHMNSNGQLQANPAALHNMANQLKDPNSQLNHQLGSAMKSLEQGNPQAMQSLLANANGGQMSAQTQQELGHMLERGATLSPSDAQAVNAFAHGQTTASGQPAIGFNNQGQLMNNQTHQPVSIAAGHPIDGHAGQAQQGTQQTAQQLAHEQQLAHQQALSANGQAAQSYVDSSGHQVSAQQYAQMAAQGAGGDFHAVPNAPSHGLEGLTGQHPGQQGAPPVLMDGNGHKLPPGAVNQDGSFAPGFQPNGPVMAYNSTNEQPIASYNPSTHQWNAVDASGHATGVSMNAQGNWVGQTANGGTTAPLTHSENGNWYAAGTHGQVQYDTGSQSLHTSGPNGTAVNYDGASHNYTAANNANINYNAQSNSFVDTANSAPVSYNGSTHNWTAQGTDGNVVVNPSSGQLSIGGSSDPHAQVSYDSQSHAYTTAGGQVHYDQASHRFETANNAPVTYDNGTFYGANSNNNVVYDQQNRQMEVASTGAPVNYSNGTYFAADTNNQVAYDPHSNTYGVANSTQQANYNSTDGTYTTAGGSVYYDKASGQMESVVNNAPVSVDNASGNWYAAGTNNAIQYDTNTGAFYTPSQAPVTYDNGQFHAAGTNGNVSYDQQSRQWEGSTSNGLAAYNYDTQSHQWAPSSGGASSGEVYRVNQDAYAQAMPSSNYAFTPSSDTSSANAVQYGGGSNYYDANQTVSNQPSGNSANTYYDAGSAQYVTTNSGANNYVDSPANQQYLAQGSTSSDYGQPSQYSANNSYTDPVNYTNSATGSGYTDPSYGNTQSGYTDPSYGNTQSGYTDPSYGNTGLQSSSNDYTQANQYNANNTDYLNSPGGGGGGGGGGSGNDYQQTNQYAAHHEHVAQHPHQEHVAHSGFTPETQQHQGQGGGYSDPVYNPGSQPTGNSNDYYATGSAPEHGSGSDHSGSHMVADNEPQRASWNGESDQGGFRPEHHEHHQEQTDYPRENHETREEMMGGGMMGQPIQQQPPQQQTAYNHPQQQSGGGTFASIIPANWGSRQPRQPQQAPQQQRPSQPEPQAPPKMSKKGMEMGAKQGGYQTDANKYRKQKDLLKESWAEFQDGQEDEEVFDLAAFGVVAISRPGIVKDITTGTEGWSLFCPDKNGIALYCDRDSTQLAKIGPLQKLTEQAEAMKLLGAKLGVSVPEFELLKDDRDGQEVGVLLMTRMVVEPHKSIQFEADNAANADRDLYKELLRQTQIVVADAEAMLAKAGFIADLSSGDTWGVGPSALEKVRAGLPITADDLIFINPISGKCPPTTEPTKPTGLTAGETQTQPAAQESARQSTDPDERWQRAELRTLLEKLNLLHWQSKVFAAGELQTLVRNGIADSARSGRTIDYANWAQLKDALIKAGILWFDDPVEPQTAPPEASAPDAGPAPAAAAVAPKASFPTAPKPAPGTQVDGHALTARGDQWYVTETNYTVIYKEETKQFVARTGQPVIHQQGSAQSPAAWYAEGTNGSVQYDTRTGTFFTVGKAGQPGGKAPVSYQPQGIGGATFYAAGTNGKVYYDGRSQLWKGVQAGQVVTYNYNGQTRVWAPIAGGETYGSASVDQTAKLPVVNDEGQELAQAAQKIQLKCNVEMEQIVTAAPKSGVVKVEIYWPVGLYQVVDNIQYADSVEFNVTLIDSKTGAVTDLGTAISCMENLLAPFTRTYKFSVPGDHYTLRLKRLTAEGNNDKNANPATFKDTIWTS